MFMFMYSSSVSVDDAAKTKIEIGAGCAFVSGTAADGLGGFGGLGYYYI